MTKLGTIKKLKRYHQGLLLKIAHAEKIQEQPRYTPHHDILLFVSGLTLTGLALVLQPTMIDALFNVLILGGPILIGLASVNAISEKKENDARDKGAYRLVMNHIEPSHWRPIYLHNAGETDTLMRIKANADTVTQWLNAIDQQQLNGSAVYYDPDRLKTIADGNVSHGLMLKTNDVYNSLILTDDGQTHHVMPAEKKPLIYYKKDDTHG